MECLKKYKERPTRTSTKQELDSELTAAEEMAEETAEESKERWRSIRLIYLTIFLMSLGFSSMILGVWPYLEKLDGEAGKEFMLFVYLANALGQVLFTPVVVWWGNTRRSVRLPLKLSLGLFTVASAVYSLLRVFPSHRKYWMLATRFLVGVSAANVAVCRSYVTAATTIKERTSTFFKITLFQKLGLAIGPALQFAVLRLGEGYSLWTGGVEKNISLNMYTACGWINVLLGIMNILLLNPRIFKERYFTTEEVGKSSKKDKSKKEKNMWRKMKPNFTGVFVLICAFYVLDINYVFVEAIGTSLAMDFFSLAKWTILYIIGMMMASVAVAASGAFLLTSCLCVKINEKTLLLGSFVIMFIGQTYYIPWKIGSSSPSRYVTYPRNNRIISENEVQMGSTTSGPIWVLEPDEIEFEYTTEYYNETSSVEDNLPKFSTSNQNKHQVCNKNYEVKTEMYLAGFIFSAIGYPIGITLTQTLITKYFGPNSKNDWLGCIVEPGLISRIMEPVFITYLCTFLGTCSLLFIATGLLAIFFIWILFVKIPQNK